MAAPRRRRRRHARRTTFRRNPIRMAVRRNPVRRRRRRHSMRRNPIRRMRRNPSRMLSGRGGINIASMILPGLMVGAGAVGAELAMGYIPLPTVLKTGPARYLTKGVISVMMGWAVAKYFNRKAGEALAMGGIAIAAHDAIKAGLVSFMPSAKFGQYMEGYNWDKYGYNTPISSAYGPGINPGIGEYMGYYSPGSMQPVQSTMGEGGFEP